MLGPGLEASDAAPLVVGVPGQAQADRELCAADETYWGGVAFP
jgi:hypothetical protein